MHAHPDDETIGTGATMARYVAEGAHVTLVTCTLGEHGEILLPEIAHLAADRDDQLGPHRQTELAAAMAELGVADHRFLGGPGRYRDSGMVWSGDGRRALPPEPVRPDSFWAADLRDAADLLVEIIREIRPQVVVTYDDNGQYGHPDHVQAHRVATYGIALAGVSSHRLDLGDPWVVQKVYWTAMPRGVIQGGLDAMAESGTPYEGLESADDLGFVVEDDAIDAVVDGTKYFQQKKAAMKAHASQIDVTEGFFALTDNVGQGIWGHEHFRLAKGPRGQGDNVNGVETDLFAGVDF